MNFVLGYPSRYSAYRCAQIIVIRLKGLKYQVKSYRARLSNVEHIGPDRCSILNAPGMGFLGGASSKRRPVIQPAMAAPATPPPLLILELGRQAALLEEILRRVVVIAGHSPLLE